MKHEIKRQRFELKRRNLTVREKKHITPHMVRILFEGEDLADFTSLGADDHVKLLFQTGADKPEMRDYTPRYFDQAAQTLAIDFAIHDAGPATRWAIDAKLGDTMEVAGPRGSVVISPTFDWWLLIGDETALPAIGRRLEELPEGTHAISIVTVTESADEQSFVTPAQHELRWIHRPSDQADDPAPILAELEKIRLPDGDGFIWIAAEARVARAVRDHVLNVWQHPREWTKAAGYWVKGVADARDKLQD